MNNRFDGHTGYFILIHVDTDRQNYFYHMKLNNYFITLASRLIN